MRIPYLSIFAVIFLAAFCALSPSSFAAQDLKAATGEDVALSFYKTSGTKPDFEKWAMQSKGFKYQSVTEARSYIRQETDRLGAKWQNLDRNGDILTVRTTSPVDILVDLEKDENDPEGYKLIILLEKTRKTFFPYTHLNENFVIIPRNLDKILTHSISRTQAELILNDIKRNMAQGAMIDFGIKPFKSYTDKPHKIGKEEQWVLMGDVVSISISSKVTGAPLWNYGAQWYVSPRGQELRSIYKNKSGANE